ncbi:NAD(P)H nitroreductase [Pseudonocardia sp. K10HN5]|uniref:NAD(P)H nitroreductase n=1 Tax=Pseudonocardia acidicola TaxID=2724939 RepID=A0ABX1SGD5_9PSEU|nr:nitroreductase family protein [Pseudonocardia acidicola]NMH99319.1 NAD(P)H nitroreductase [Pseudonocardia acidicola]
MRRAVELALHAPSVHNTQPWRWRLGDDHVELHADWNRHLIGTDPDRRDLVLSCGAALHHVRVALAGLGVASDTVRLPDPENSAHLATVHARPGQPDARDGELMRAIPGRRTDRRLFSMRPVPPEQLQALASRAAGLGAALHAVVDERARGRLDATLTEAAAHQHYIVGYTAELAIWTRRYAGSHDGIPPASRPGPGAGSDFCGLGRLPRVRASGGPREPAEDAAVMTVLTTHDDDILARLRAGEASSAVLLAATRQGLATTPLSQALAVAHTRRRLREDILRTPDNPQLIIRMGWAPDCAAELPPTPRRRLEAMLVTLD